MRRQLRQQRHARWWLLAAAAAAVIAAGPTVAVVLDDDAPFDPARGISVADVLSSAQRYVGDEISVVGNADVVTDDALTMGDDDLIVVAADPSEQNFERRCFFTGDRVRATGTLHILDAYGLVERLPDRSLLPPQFRGFERQPVLFAEHVTPAETHPKAGRPGPHRAERRRLDDRRSW